MLALVVAAQIAIVAHAPDSVNACEPLELSVAVSAVGNEPARLATPAMQPFDLLRRTSMPRVGHSGGETSSEYRFVLTTGRVGDFVIGPFEAKLGSERATTRPIRVSVRPQRGRAVPSIIARSRIDTSTSLALTGVSPADTIYVGQQATYEVAVFLNQAARDRLRRNPTFYPPEMQAMLAYDLPGTSGRSREHLGSQCFDALVYRRALFPLVGGRIVIPPAQLVYSTGLGSSSLFSREESHELQTDSVTIVALEPPEDGRPNEFSGAIGRIALEALLDSTSSRVGDPMLFTVRVSGTGNVRLFPRPELRVPWAALVAADERVSVDTTSTRIGGVKEFDWVLTPRVAGEFDVPPVRYGYFDPSRRRYDVAVSDRQHVHVAPGYLASADTGRAEATLAIRAYYSGSAWPPPQSSPGFWFLLALAPVPAIARGVKRRAARQKSPAPPDPLKVLTAAPAVEAVALRRQYVRAFGHRLGCNPEDFTHPGALDRALRRAGVSEPTAVRAESLLRELDTAAYAGRPTLPSNATREAAAIARAVDAEALARRELPFWVPALLLAASLAIVGEAIASDAAAAPFARGVSAYLRQDFSASRDAFAASVTLAPDAPDSWANYGTASWQAADTAAAIYGWRQALALQPSAPDMQTNITAARDLSPSSPGWVPPLPRSTMVWLFAALWMTAWLVAWLARSAGAQDWMRRVPVPLVICALLVGLAAIEVEGRVAGAKLGVVRHAGALTTDPALGMDRGPAVATGEIVRVVGRRGAWTRVQASDEREGWISTMQLLLVSDRRPPQP